MNIEIRKETEKDYFETEKMVRESFWNKYQPGCNEHYMVHLMRNHESWLPELSRIALVDGNIAGVIMYFKSKITQPDGKKVQIVSFGPLCVSHKYRNCGIGKKLMEETLPLVKAAGFPGVLIIGEPDYYPKIGFIRCKDRGITDSEGNAWDPYMVYEFQEGSMKIPGVFEEPYEITDGIPSVPPFDYESQFEPWTRATIPCQFEYPNPTENNNGYHLQRAEEKPVVFVKMFNEMSASKTKGCAEEILQNPLSAEFIIKKENKDIGICIFNFESSKPEISCVFLEKEFRENGIEEDIQKTFQKMNI